MKKIRCSMDFNDYLAVDSDEQYAFITIQCGNRSADIALSPSKIRKLRKQLKRALIEIEGSLSEYTEKSGEHQISSSQVSGPYIGNKFFLTESDDWPVSLSNYGIEKARKKTSGKRS